VVVTTLNQHHPLIRFATGDLSAILPGVSPCGRTNRRIKGWMGRADQAAKVRGMFVRRSRSSRCCAPCRASPGHGWSSRSMATAMSDAARRGTYGG
jgi:phenylacetate-coenzyme A ligase PaaK-like adenylate-forming protein